MADVYIDPLSNSLHVRMNQNDFINDPRGVADEARIKIVDFLAKEFIKKHGDDILEAIHVDDVAYGMVDVIKEVIKQKLLLKENTNEPS